MLTLHLLRHAKSAWDHSGLSDKERPLNERGIRSCGVVGPAIYKRGYNFTNVFCSAGLRAQQTIAYVNESLPNVDIEWEVCDALYTFDAQALLAWCCERYDVDGEMMIVGHNPAITELSATLSGRYVDHVPTCSYVKLECDINTWQALKPHCATITEFITPKSL